MVSFLDTVAEGLHKRYGEKLSELCLVFPNRRAHLFFAQRLSRILKKPLWQPAYRSIEELVKETSPWRVPDNFTLLVELYGVYCAERHIDEPFDRFYYWGETMLYDFDQIDKFMANAAALFTNLRERKAMESDFSFLTPEQVAHIQQFWSHFAGSNESRLQEAFIAIWDALPDIYQRFRERLIAQNRAYEGMVYRHLAEKIISGDTAGLLPGRYVFIGFNALNECEKILFRYLQTQLQADFYWDYDAYYVNNAQQEAGYFLRDNLKHFPPPEYDPGFSPFAAEKQLTIVATSSNISQVKVTPQLLKSMQASPDARTAVVLADEQLLPPLLHTLPAVSEEINITMGYPLRQTGVYALLELLWQLFTHAKPAETATKYYYKDILAVVTHQYIKQLISKETDNIRNKLVLYNNIYVPDSFFSDNQFLSDLLAPLDNYRELTARLLFLLDRLSQNEPLRAADPLLRGYIQHIVRQINRLSSALDGSRFGISIKLYAKLLREILQNERIPFTGEPLAGIQVMGLLETRVLDFDNLVVLSANEGILPRAGNYISFIPYNLRRGFGLPTPEYQDAVWAYYFYRLLQRARNVKLVYSTKTESTRTGEASRYLLQLKLESGHPVKEETLNIVPQAHKGGEEAIILPPGSPQWVLAQQAIARYAHAPDAEVETLPANSPSFSPTALTAYLSCPLRFYFRYVEHIKEPEEVTEKVDNRLFGNLLHKAMEIIYTPWIKKEVTARELDALLNAKNNIEEIVKQAIAAAYYQSDTLPPDFFENGDLLMAGDILHKYVRQLLFIDRQQAPFIPEGMELQVKQLFPFYANGQARQLLFGGVIDRLHRRGNTLYVVDYKTGVIDNKFESIAELFGEKQHPAVLQILLYSMMMHRETKQPVAPLLYFLRNSYSEAADFSLYDKGNKRAVATISDYAEELAGTFAQTLSALFDNNRPITQTADDKQCKYCPYRIVCNKN
ncbi:MAG: PD-(D/E)XK nuclease family protein [Prevotellaceae bacterium]|jgi:RecB family exonuclease|nr:PD-(D/E)XK nuclease family protein [Prevotellaceae bacterium]